MKHRDFLILLCNKLSLPPDESRKHKKEKMKAGAN